MPYKIVMQNDRNKPDKNIIAATLKYQDLAMSDKSVQLRYSVYLSTIREAYFHSSSYDDVSSSSLVLSDMNFNSS